MQQSVSDEENSQKISDKQIDQTDILASIGSGALTAAMDVLWVKDISLADAHDWGTTQINDLVIKCAKSKGYKGDNLAGAIKKLEDVYPSSADELTEEFGGGASHHLRDFSHHFSPIGLMFSLISQFTGRAYGTDTSGIFVSYEIPGWKQMGWEESIYMGTVRWFFHLISDMAGSSNSVRMGGEGTGIPGPLMSFLKEISAIPGVQKITGHYADKAGNNPFSVKCSKLFNGTLLGEHDENGKIVRDGQLRFDLRTELGIVHESIKNKQYIPVVLNILIVAAVYSVRRFVNEIETHQISETDELDQIDIKKCLPWKNGAFSHMWMISAATFSAIDLTSAGIKAAVKNKNNKKGFTLDFLQGINYWGLGNLAMASFPELVHGVEKAYTEYTRITEEIKQRYGTAIDIAEYAVSAGISIAKMGTPMGYISAAIGVYKSIKESLDELEESRQNRAEVEALCAERITVLEEYRQEMEQSVSDYFTSKFSVFVQAMEKIDRAITANDIDAFISGNNMLQLEMGKKSQFSNMDEFDDLMLSDDAVRF